MTLNINYHQNALYFLSYKPYLFYTLFLYYQYQVLVDYKLNYYISEIDEKENRFNYTQNNDVEKIIRLIGIGDKRKKDDFKLGVITLDLSMFKDKDGKEIYKKLFDKLEKERLTQPKLCQSLIIL